MQVTLIGNLGSEPQLKRTNSGTAVVNLSVATRNPDGTTEWHRVAVFGKQAENCSKFLTKGSKVGLNGKLSYNTWTDAATGEKNSRFKITARSVEFLSPKSSGSRGMIPDADISFHDDEMPF